MNLAIVIGVEKYNSAVYDDLLACKNDAELMAKVLGDVKEFDEILCLSNNEGSVVTKSRVAAFVDRHKGKLVEEVVFYFSGHGERHGEDFLYLFSDFDRSKKESTSLRNTELDGLVKSLAPKLFVKIVDACYSGTQYINGSEGVGVKLDKSARESGLKNVYFLFSSRENEASYAGKEFSVFSESLFTSITSREGEFRYRDIMAYIADDLESRGEAKPVFLSQADNTEKFGNVTEKTHGLIYDAFGISLGIAAKSTDDSALIESSGGECELSGLVKRVSEVSSASCFSEKLLKDFIEQFNSLVESWPSAMTDLYNVRKIGELRNFDVPNSISLGEWISKNSELGFFVEPYYTDESYTVQEYRELPKKRSSSRFDLFSAAALFDSDNSRYKLEDVYKTRQAVSGFAYLHAIPGAICQIMLESRYQILNDVCMYFVPFYSDTKFSMNYSHEFLKKIAWGKNSPQKCEYWRRVDVNIKGEDSARGLADHIQQEITEWIKAEVVKLVK